MSHDSGGPRVLLIDKNEHTSSIVAPILWQIGIRNVVARHTVHEAFVIIPHLKPEIILLEWAPKESMINAKFIDILRNSRRAGFADAHFVALMDQPYESAVAAAKGAGVASIVIKPFSPKTLNDRISALLRRKPEPAGPENNGVEIREAQIPVHA